MTTREQYIPALALAPHHSRMDDRPVREEEPVRLPRVPRIQWSHVIGDNPAAEARIHIGTWFAVRFHQQEFGDGWWAETWPVIGDGSRLATGLFSAANDEAVEACIAKWIEWYARNPKVIYEHRSQPLLEERRDVTHLILACPRIAKAVEAARQSASGDR